MPVPPSCALGGRIALVTGSARGLGLEMARGLAQAGAQVVLNGQIIAIDGGMTIF